MFKVLSLDSFNKVKATCRGGQAKKDFVVLFKPKHATKYEEQSFQKTIDLYQDLCILNKVDFNTYLVELTSDQQDYKSVPNFHKYNSKGELVKQHIGTPGYLTLKSLFD